MRLQHGRHFPGFFTGSTFHFGGVWLLDSDVSSGTFLQLMDTGNVFALLVKEGSAAGLGLLGPNMIFVRGGTGLHIGIGTGLCFSYILFNRFFEEFAKSGTLPPGLAVWLPNIIYLGIAVYLYRKAPK